MDRQRWKEIEAIYQVAVDKAEDQRQAYLDQVCADDADLRSEVDALLAVRESQGAGLVVPALEQVAQSYRAVARGRLIGQRLGSYEVLSLLGKGGMGEVYLARDSRLDRQLAIKVLPADVAEDPERLRRFVREAKAASALNHPNIATIHEIGESEGIHWIAMELVEGQTLEERIHGHGHPHPVRQETDHPLPPSGREHDENRGLISPRGREPESAKVSLAPDRRRGSRGEGARASLKTAEILDISIQAADGLEAAHKKGIIHRDLKPANIMLTAEGRVKVLDFGLAKRIPPETPSEGTAASTESQTTPGVIMGTVDYMSPEQVLGLEVDQRTDLFSLGVVLYNMATGRLPFSGATGTDTMYKILHAEPEAIGRINPGSPPELERIVEKCLEKDQGLRYQHASDLCSDLKRLKRDTEVGTVGTEVSKLKRQRLLIWALALLLIGVVAGGGFWFFRKRNEITEAPMLPVPFTTDPGFQLWPSFSPDGKQVAFAMNSEKQDNWDIYIKQIGSETPRRLTTDPHDDALPAWSPDGLSIAFVRGLDDSKQAVMLVPANGGRERPVAEFQGVEGVGWHPGGKWLVVACKDSPGEPRAIYLISLETGEKRRLTSPPQGIGGDEQPAFSPDGRWLAFTRALGGASEIFVLPVSARLEPGAEPKQLTFGDRTARYPAWMPDGKELVFIYGSKSLHCGLWRVSISGSDKPRPLPFSGEGSATSPSVSQENHRLVYATVTYDINIWRHQIPRGKQKPAPPSRFFPSSQTQELPLYSPDGKEVAYVSYASGASEIWISGSDGSSPLQLTHFGGPMPNGPRWSPDGKQLVFSMASGDQMEIFTIPAQGGQAKQLTHTPFNKGNPSYSQDGKWIYFDWTRGGDAQIWKMPVEGGEPVQVTRKGGAGPLESMDGGTLFYLKGGYFSELWMVPVGRGEETRILDGVLAGHYDVKEHGIYYFSGPDWKNTKVSYYDLASRKTKLLTPIQGNVLFGFTVSADEDWFLVTQGNGWERSNLMLVENFR